MMMVVDFSSMAKVCFKAYLDMQWRWKKARRRRLCFSTHTLYAFVAMDKQECHSWHNVSLLRWSFFGFGAI